MNNKQLTESIARKRESYIAGKRLGYVYPSEREITSNNPFALGHNIGSRVALNKPTRAVFIEGVEITKSY